MSLTINQDNEAFLMQKSNIMEHNPDQKTDVLYNPLRKVLLKTETGQTPRPISVHPNELTTSYLMKGVYTITENEAQNIVHTHLT